MLPCLCLEVLPCLGLEALPLRANAPLIHPTSDADRAPHERQADQRAARGIGRGRRADDLPLGAGHEEQHEDAELHHDVVLRAAKRDLRWQPQAP